MVQRAYYDAPVRTLLRDSSDRILGCLAIAHHFDLERAQREAWLEEIRILKRELAEWPAAHVFFEYSIPRMGKRVDVVLILHGIIFVLEFKVGESRFGRDALDQVMDYCLDLKYFHAGSRGRRVVPVVIATKANSAQNVIAPYDDAVYRPLCSNGRDLANTIASLVKGTSEVALDPADWAESEYRPTPTIIEAAQAMYTSHSVAEISRCDAAAKNLAVTSGAILDIIQESRQAGRKAICFVTGVPGAGKTLAGLNIAGASSRALAEEQAVFLSGNGPLVEVLREALARNAVATAAGTKERPTKREALRRAGKFVQNVHHFRDEYFAKSTSAPVEKVVIFDEAQRAWTREQTAKFMRSKKGIGDFDQSEPEFLVSVMDRHPDWAAIVCLVGGGQEINTGEAGLPEWFRAIKRKFPSWRVYASDQITDYEYLQGAVLSDFLPKSQTCGDSRLHLSVSVRSFRSERVSGLVKAILDVDPSSAQSLRAQIGTNYEIVLTRDIERARNWLRTKQRGTERSGILASSGANRLKPTGLNVQVEIGIAEWLLNGKDDVRSSFYLEDVATEFAIQGLEVDWACVAWDADLRYLPAKGAWEFHQFLGTKWRAVRDTTRRLYLKNAYRVLLTRARQGMVIFVPRGSDEDATRRHEFYDGTYGFLRQVGIPEV